ncbi:unnamed protein product [Rotaria magnacalcarata]|uniref:CCHC-type domain-containing protein n=1 Tax=Rotaria magnacalcarata TaxID=392030 RepID=A0A819XRR3_9BILA|nr:unnamed protein product [Rotaria magnacalcarata]CAF4143698.1 unnamed protein product [Rotaria magnacalcarata]
MDKAEYERMFQKLSEAVTHLTANTLKQETQINAQNAHIAALKKEKKVPEPEPFNLDGGTTLPEFFIIFEDYCKDLYGNTKKDAWSPVLKKFLEGEVQQAYIDLKGGNLKWNLLKNTLTTQFAINRGRTKNYKRLFSQLGRDKDEPFFTLSYRVSRLTKQAHPTFRKPELNELAKEKFLEIIPDDLENLLELVLIEKDMESVELSKLVSLAERLESSIPKKFMNDNVKINTVTEKVKFNPDMEIKGIASFRPNGGTVNSVYNDANQSNQSIINRQCLSCNNFGHWANACRERPQSDNINSITFQNSIKEANNQFRKRMCANVQISSVNDVLYETTNNKINSVVKSSETDIYNLNLITNENSGMVRSDMIVEPITINVKETISNFDLNYIEDDKTNSAMNEIETTNKISEEASNNLNDEYDIDSGMSSFDNQVEPEGTENVKYDVNDTHNLNIEMHCIDSEPVGFQGSDYNVSSQYDESDKIGTCDNKTEPVGSESINYNYQDEYDKYSEKENVDSEVNPETEEFETANCNFSYQYDESNKIDMFNDETEPMSGENINYNYNYQYDLCNKDSEKDSFKSEVNHEHESFQTASYNFSYQYDENDRVNTSNNEPESEPGYRYENDTMNEWYKEILARTENEENFHFDVKYKDRDDEISEPISPKVEDFKQISPVVNSRLKPSTKAKVDKVSCIKPKAKNVVKDIYKSEISSNKKVKASKKGGKTEPITSIIESNKYNLKPRADLSVKVKIKAKNEIPGCKKDSWKTRAKEVTPFTVY